MRIWIFVLESMQIRISDQRFSERNIPTSGVQGIRIFIFKEGYG